MKRHNTKSDTTIKTGIKKRIVRPFDYYALLFFATAFAGWLWEVLLYLITAHTFVNRGVYQGPCLPIYGVGGIMLFLLLHKLRKKTVWVFICSATLCTLLEYFAGAWLEWKWGIRWWDYSGHLLNLNGYVCLTSTVCFGLGGVLLICVLQPVFNKFYHHMTIRLRVTLCLLFILLFVIDAAYSVMQPNTGNHISSAVIIFFIYNHN
ncbi:MAG: putative ABC transporter permease [Lachnospiraceae bacterium]|nr:putative ABC transporter permease [Lachnospiraceae bacterium]